MPYSLAPKRSLSRRSFLKFSGLGLAAFLLPLPHPTAAETDLQGRVLDSSVNCHAEPSLNSQLVRVFWKDSVLPIDGATIGDDQTEHNRVWYQVGGPGFIHSSGVQPVKTLLNDVLDEIPEGGKLAEVTVPYTDAYWGPGKEYLFAYRYYYGTTAWIIGVSYDLAGTAWYRIFEDKWEYSLYIPAAHLRILPGAELSILSPSVPASQKRIEVHLAEQKVIAYEYDRAVFMARTATGALFRDGDYRTRPGRYQTFHKRPSRHMARGNLAANGYDLPGVPWVTYITEEGISFHGTFWHNDFGKPRSHGCINLTPQAAKWIYLWTLPHVPSDQQMVYEDTGTQVDIF